MKYLCFDLGLSHTGVAISYEGQLAQGLTTIDQTDRLKLFNQLLRLIQEHQPDRIVIGQPARGPVHELALNFRHFLEPLTNAAIDFHNEDRSTSQAELKMIETHQSLHHRKAKQHQTAAAHLLQEYLDNL